MAYFEGFKCDGPGCNNIRTPSNGWYIGCKKVGGGVFLYGFNEQDARSEDSILLCGESCVQKFVSANLKNLHGGV